MAWEEFPEGTEFIHWRVCHLDRYKTFASVAMIESGQHDGKWAALVIDGSDDTAARFHWIESEPFEDREDANDLLDAFLSVWCGRRWNPDEVVQ